MPRVALPRSLQLRRISGCLYTPLTEINIFLRLRRLSFRPLQKTSSYDTPFQDSTGYPRILDIVDLRPLRDWHAYKASSRSALTDSLLLC
jgi:hypothetical protein